MMDATLRLSQYGLFWIISNGLMDMSKFLILLLVFRIWFLSSFSSKSLLEEKLNRLKLFRWIYHQNYKYL